MIEILLNLLNKISELFENGVEQQLNLAEKLIYFIDNKQRRTEYAKKAVKTVNKKFSQENHIKKITAIYKKLLNE